MAKKSESEEREVIWGRSRRMNEFRRFVIDVYKGRHGGDIIEEPGFYFGTVEVQWQTEGTSRNGNFVITAPPGLPVVDGAFNLAIGDVSTTWFSTSNPKQPHILTDADTNLQNPGQSLFADEVFVIEAISARQRGMSIGFNPADLLTIRPAPTGNTLSMLQGNQMLRDERGLVIPSELFNKFDDSFRLAKTLEEVASLHFVWRDNQVGGSTKVWDKYIESFLNVTQHETSLKRTSGGAPILDLPQGYIWCLDKQFQTSVDMGGNGLFDAELHVSQSVSAPFTPTRPFGSAAPLLPIGMAFYWELRVFGTALLPGYMREGNGGKQRRPREGQKTI